MVQNCKDTFAKESDGKVEVELYDKSNNILNPTPLSKIDLRDAHAIRREMASVYRDARARTLDSKEASRLVYILDMLRKAFDTGELQERLELVERTLNSRRL
ncbi:hypothetical protein K1X76_08680 [bacterium]|nr:hypothetical protein [bacterium]